jgi:hypothetical protein
MGLMPEKNLSPLLKERCRNKKFAPQRREERKEEQKKEKN